MGNFEKAPSPSHTQANINPGEQRRLFFACGLLACDLHWHSALAAKVMWPMTSRRQSLSFSCPLGESPGVFVQTCSPSSHITHAHASSTWSPAGNQKQAAARNKLSYKDDHLIVTYGHQRTLNWSRNCGRWLSSWFCWGDGLWDTGSPFSQIMPHLNKTSFFLHQHLPHEFSFCGKRQL